MSRSYCSYDEDWQRRKSVLIRSLFHDIPILSPVDEESDSSHYNLNVPTQEAFPSPPRPYSPLPPLIIEREPITNKHDDPEEYYTKLHKKIKKIYIKLFIDNRNLNSVDYGSNCNDSIVNDDSEHESDDSVENIDFNFMQSNSPKDGHFDSIIEDRVARLSSASTKSNGYGADFESMDTAIVDVVNYTASSKEVTTISEDENIDGEEIRNEDSNNCRSSGNTETNRERIDDEELNEEEEPNHSTIDDQEMTESEECNQTEDEDNFENEDSNIAECGITRVSNQREKSKCSDSDDHEMADSEKSDETEKEQQSNNVTKTDRNLIEKEFKSKEDGRKESNDKLIGDIEPMEGDVEIRNSSEESPDYRQITTAAVVHFDGSQEAGEQESRVYEDSVKSIPTRSRRAVIKHYVDVEDRIEVLSVLDKNAGPNYTPTFSTDESETTDGESEEDQPDSTEEDDEEMSNHQLNADAEKDVEAMRVLAPETTKKRIQAMETPHPDCTDKETVVIRSLQQDVNDEEDEGMSSYLPTNSEKGLQATNTPHSDGIDEETEVIRNLQQDVTDEEAEGMSSHLPTNSEKGIQATNTPHLEATDEETVVIRSLRKNVIEEEDVGMSSHQSTNAEEDIEMRSLESAATEKITEAIRAHITEATMEKEIFEIITRQKNVKDEHVGDTTLQQAVTEEESEAMRSHQPVATQQDIDKMRSREHDTTQEESSLHQLETAGDGIEQMRTPRPHLSQDTLPITQRSESESTYERTVYQKALTSLTSSSQDGAARDISELQTSNDMNEILTSIFNESGNFKDRSPILARKRKLIDKSVQTAQASRVTWEDMRENFFVATPKIFRLCACSDHICY